MIGKALDVFRTLMKCGWIDRHTNPEMWRYSLQPEVLDLLEEFKISLAFDLYRTNSRLYLIPTQENELFLKNNIDFRKDIKADNTIRIRDLYLLNYLSVYILYIFFNGAGADPLCREFITKEDLASKFTEHCKTVERTELSDGIQQTDYSENFRQLAVVWLGKIDGELNSQKHDCRYGVINRILNKFKTDGLFEVDDDIYIKPTRKLKDLMPYFLRKKRVIEINNWLQGGDTDAAAE